MWLTPSWRKERSSFPLRSVLLSPYFHSKKSSPASGAGSLGGAACTTLASTRSLGGGSGGGSCGGGGCGGGGWGGGGRGWAAARAEAVAAEAVVAEAVAARVPAAERRRRLRPQVWPRRRTATTTRRW